ncbi:hypothetical protein BH09SUM1_BH09SUM1_01460 [soil metagenome]
MRGWTGGQYSIYRVLLGSAAIAVCGWIATRGGGLLLALSIPGIVAGLMLMIGLRDRLAGFFLAALFLTFEYMHPVGWISFLLLAVACGFHGMTMTAPYGSWAARGRRDPNGGWRWNPKHYRAACLAIAGYGALEGVRLANDLLFRTVGFAEAARAFLAIGLFVAMIGAALILHRSVPAAAWGAMAFLALVLWLLVGSAALNVGFFFLWLFLFDPAWIPGSRKKSRYREIVFFDGECGLCHALVRMLFAEDRKPVFTFAPLQGETGKRLLPEAVRKRIGDSFGLYSGGGRVLTRSRGALLVAERLGGLWRVLAVIGKIIPSPLADVAYSAIAAIRGWLFTKPNNLCPVIPRHLRRRMLP